MTRWALLHFEDWALHRDEHADITARVCEYLSADEPVQVVTPSSGVDSSVEAILDWLAERVTLTLDPASVRIVILPERDQLAAIVAGDDAPGTDRVLVVLFSAEPGFQGWILAHGGTDLADDGAVTVVPDPVVVAALGMVPLHNGLAGGGNGRDRLVETLVALHRADYSLQAPELEAAAAAAGMDLDDMVHVRTHARPRPRRETVQGSPSRVRTRCGAGLGADGPAGLNPARGAPELVGGSVYPATSESAGGASRLALHTDRGLTPLRNSLVVANGLSTDHPVPGRPFVDDTHLPQHPTWIERTGRHRGTGSWGRCDGPGFGAPGEQWAAFTTDQTHPEYAWCVRHHPVHGRSIVLVRDSDAATLHTAWISSATGPLLLRAGGYWWDGQRWNRPRQVEDTASGTYARRRAVDATCLTAHHLLSDSAADPSRAALADISTIEPDDEPENWVDHLALWAAARGERSRPLTECIVDLCAPELAADQLLDIDELATMIDIEPGLAHNLMTRGQQLPIPQTVEGGRPLWSKPVAADWLEQRQRSTGIDETMSTPVSENPRGIVIGLNALWDTLTESFAGSLRQHRRPAPTRVLKRLQSPAPEPESDSERVIARDLAWTAALTFEQTVPFRLVAATIRTAVLSDFAAALALDTALNGGRAPYSPDNPPHVTVNPQHAKTLDWVVRHAPAAAQHAIGEIVGDAEHELGIPRSSTTYALAAALALDGALPEAAYDQFLERAFPPDSD